MTSALKLGTAPGWGSVTIKNNPKLADTLAVMVAKSKQARKELRPLAEHIVKKLYGGDYNSEIMSIYAWVDANVRYVKDPHDVELVKDPRRCVETGQGDCDDIACLIASLCMAVGHECRYVVVGFEPNVPSHVVCQCAVRGVVSHGGGAKGAKDWVTLDPVANLSTAEMHSRVQYAKVYGI